MKIGRRNLSKVVSAVFDKRHYKAIKNMICSCNNFRDFFSRYFFASGNYPAKINITANRRELNINVYSYHDILTINEVFFREDYYAEDNVQVIVDIGSNIGISALYFLTRNDRCKCYLFEPVDSNLTRLKKNLKDFISRIEVCNIAVWNCNKTLKFAVEETGRYGSLITPPLNEISTINVNCVHINNILADILAKNKFIDILKIDTEGVEIDTVKAIKNEYLQRIRLIYIEAHPTSALLDKNMFAQYFNGGIYVMKNKKLFM
jgi:FkbM family methyltransferase